MAVRIGRFRSRYRPSRHLGNWENPAGSCNNAYGFDKTRSLSNDGKNQPRDCSIVLREPKKDIQVPTVGFLQRFSPVPFGLLATTRTRDYVTVFL